MEFQHEAHKATYEKVKQYLGELFGELIDTHPQYPAFRIRHGSTFVHVFVHPWGDGDAFVQVRAWVVLGAEVTPDLTNYLLHENVNFRFGAYGLDTDNDIVFQHSIVGSTMDKEELKASVLAVLFTADQVDDEIQRRWGGRKATDPT